MKIFGREPALVVGAVGSLLTVLAALNLDFLNAGQAAALTALLSALVIAVFTRPVAPAVFTAVVSAGAALALEYGVHVSDGVVASVTAAVLALCTLFGVRPQVNPTNAAGDVVDHV